MSTLEVEFLGFKLHNPFLLASAPPTNTVEMMARAFELGWAGAVTKTIPLEKVPVRNVTPRIHSIAFPGFAEEGRKVSPSATSSWSPRSTPITGWTASPGCAATIRTAS